MRIGGEAFEVEVAGDAGRPAVVLSNALGLSRAMWDRQVPALLARFRVVRYEGRGHRGGAAAAAPLDLARLGNDVLAILDALGIARTHVVGATLGGAVGLWLLAHAPERVDRLVLVGTALRPDPRADWNGRIRRLLAGDAADLAAATADPSRTGIRARPAPPRSCEVCAGV